MVPVPPSPHSHPYPYPDLPYPQGGPPSGPRRGGTGFRTTTLIALAAALVAGTISVALLFTSPSTVTAADRATGPDPELVESARKIVCLPLTLGPDTFDDDFRRAEEVTMGEARKMLTQSKKMFREIIVGTPGSRTDCTVDALSVVEQSDTSAELLVAVGLRQSAQKQPPARSLRYTMAKRDGTWLIEKMDVLP